MSKPKADMISVLYHSSGVGLRQTKEKNIDNALFFHEIREFTYK